MRIVRLGLVTATREELRPFFPAWLVARLPEGETRYAYGTFEDIIENVTGSLTIGCPITQAAQYREFMIEDFRDRGAEFIPFDQACVRLEKSQMVPDRLLPEAVPEKERVPV